MRERERGGRGGDLCALIKILSQGEMRKKTLAPADILNSLNTQSTGIRRVEIMEPAVRASAPRARAAYSALWIAHARAQPPPARTSGKPGRYLSARIYSCARCYGAGIQFPFGRLTEMCTHVLPIYITKPNAEEIILVRSPRTSPIILDTSRCCVKHCSPRSFPAYGNCNLCNATAVVSSCIAFLRTKWKENLSFHSATRKGRNWSSCSFVENSNDCNCTTEIQALLLINPREWNETNEIVQLTETRGDPCKPVPHISRDFFAQKWILIRIREKKYFAWKISILYACRHITLY